MTLICRLLNNTIITGKRFTVHASKINLTVRLLSTNPQKRNSDLTIIILINVDNLISENEPQKPFRLAFLQILYRRLFLLGFDFHYEAKTKINIFLQYKSYRN